MEGQSPYSARVGSSYATHCEERGREAKMAFDSSGLTITDQTLWSEAEEVGGAPVMRPAQPPRQSPV